MVFFFFSFLMKMGNRKKPTKRLLPRIGDGNPTRLVSLSLRSDDVWSIVSIALKPLIIPRAYYRRGFEILYVLNHAKHLVDYCTFAYEIIIDH